MKAYKNTRMTAAAALLVLLGTTGCNEQPFIVDVPIRVVSVHPSGSDVPRDVVVEAIFSEKVVAESVKTDANFYLEDISDPQNPVLIDANNEYIPESFMATLKPYDPLDYSTEYRVTLTTEILRDRDWGPLPVEVTGTFRTLDPPPLALAGSLPGVDSPGAPRGTAITLTFSEPVDCDSLTTGVSVAEVFDPHPHTGPGQRDVTGTWDCSEPATIDVITCDGNDYCIATFTPTTPFLYSSDVTVTLTGGRRQAGVVQSNRATPDGGQLPEDLVFGFHVEDPGPLSVSAVEPPAGGEMVDRDAVLSFIFSEALDCQSVNDMTVQVTETLDIMLGGGTSTHSGTLACNDGDPVVTFDPGTTFNYSSQIDVVLKGGAYPGDVIESAVATSLGGQQPGGFTYGFIALDPPPLVVVNATPGGFQDNVVTEADIVVTFSEPLDRSSVDASSFVVEDVTDPGNPVPITCAYSFSGGDAVAACDPAADFPFDATIQVRLTTDLHSTIATSRGGYLPQELVWTFEVIPIPPIEVVQIVPRDGAQNVPVATDISVVFNQDVLPSTLQTYDDQKACAVDADCPGTVACGNVNAGYCDPDPANLTVWLNPGAASDIDARLALDLISYDANTFTAMFDPAADLTPGTQHTFTIRGGVSGVRGRYAASSMVADFNSNFTTGINELLATTIPGDVAVDVPVTTEVCAVFLEDIDPATIDTSSFTLTFTDDFGTHGVPVLSFTFTGVDPSTLEPDSTGMYTNNQVCLVIDPEFWDCHPDARPLLYNTTYQGALTDAITNADGSIDLAGGYAWIFSTGGPPQVAGAYGENHVVTVDPLDRATDVPVNSSFFVVFADELDPSTLDAARLQLLDETGAPVAASVSTSPDSLQAVITPDSILDYDAAYTLVLSGGYDGVWLADGSYLNTDFLAAFSTSPPSYAAISPPVGESAYSTGMIPVIFTREMYFPSLNETSIYAVDNTDGVTLQGVVGTNTGDRDSAVLQILPAAESGHDVTVFVTAGAEDFRGNPLATGTQVNYPTIGNTPALNARIPDDFTAANLAPADGSDVQGDQVFILTGPIVGGNLRGRMLPSTFNTQSIEFLAGGAAGCPTELFGSTNTFNIGASGLPDTVAIQGNEKMLSGCNYRLILHQAMFANVYSVSPTETADVVVNFTGESVPPTLLAADIRADAMGGPDVSADGRNDVWSRTSIRATFSENMDAPTISAVTYTLVCGGNPRAGVIITTGPVATFEPLTPLPGGAACTVTLTSFVTDVAGNSLGGNVSASFTVESTPPSVVASAPPDGAGGVLVDTDIAITFSEEVDPATAIASTTSTAGTIQLWDRDANTEIYGCISPGSGPEEIVFAPYRDLQPATNYEILIATGVADFGGTHLTTDVLSAFTTQ
jgi:hypothetical protein